MSPSAQLAALGVALALLGAALLLSAGCAGVRQGRTAAPPPGAKLSGKT